MQFKQYPLFSQFLFLSSLTTSIFVFFIVISSIIFVRPTNSNKSEAIAKNNRSVAEAIAELNRLIIDLKKTIIISPQPIPWPHIHERAKLARVPVIMYHDILSEKEVFFDVTPEELEADFKLIKSSGIIPITLEQLVAHLQTGIPLPEKPVLLTFDDGYKGHYQYVYPLLQKYGFPAVFSVYLNKMNLKMGRPGVTWEQLQEMAANPLVTIASHSMTHPDDLTTLSEEELTQEIVNSKRLLEEKLGISIPYFTYPAGKSDERVRKMVTKAGYQAALSMDDLNEDFAGSSKNLLAINRFGQSRLERVTEQAWGGSPLPRLNGIDDGFNFTTPIRKQEHTLDEISLILVIGGRPKTIHANSRYQVAEIIKNTGAVAAVDGAFFSLKYLDSNVLIGPVLTNKQQFISGNDGENRKLQGRPLVLIDRDRVSFVPFVPNQHNTLAGIKAELKSVEDAFVGAAWLVKNGEPQPAETFGSLFDFDALRHRAFWGIDYIGQPVIGISTNLVDSVSLGKVLHKLGLKDAVMLDSGASTSLAYQGNTLVNYIPRPVPHVVALFPTNSVKVK
ncbi:polysaccharide deacetylase family protein [Pleurocapsales cyanobacterium LEGE 06147]|nr:polysaccharide deacetylase family protein [Pleurocapsales cyanobacterium LEGE 06147]